VRDNALLSALIGAAYHEVVYTSDQV
jgi:hypothetical protein